MLTKFILLFVSTMKTYYLSGLIFADTKFSIFREELISRMVNF